MERCNDTSAFTYEIKSLKTGEISIGIDRAEREGYFLSEGQEGGVEKDYNNRNLTLEKRGINMAKKEERFEVIFRDGSQLKDEGVRQILVDKETGVNYLCWKSGYGAGITPLLDSEGKVIVTK